MKRLIISILLLSFSKTYSNSPENLQELVSRVKQDIIYKNMEELTGETNAIIDGSEYCIKSRMFENEGNDLAARYLLSKLKSYGYEAEIKLCKVEDWGTVKNVRFEMLIAEKRGSVNPEEYIVYCAHYDAMGDNGLAPGADDNGSGVAAVLEAARILRDIPTRKSIVFTLFDGEECGYSCAHHFVDSVYNKNLKMACINNDMIGYDWADKKVLFIASDTSHINKELINLAHTAVDNIEISNSIADRYLSLGAGDALAFSMKDYPQITFIEDFMNVNPNYHSSKDKLATLNEEYFIDNIKASIATLALCADAEGINSVASDSPNDRVIITEARPNPTYGEVNFDIRLINTVSEMNLSVFNHLGEEVLRDSYFNMQSGSHKINIMPTARMAPGVYYVRFLGINHCNVVRKFVLNCSL